MFKTLRNMGKLIKESTELAVNKLEQANKNIDQTENAKKLALRRKIQSTDFSNHPDVLAAIKQVDKLINP